MDEIPGPAQGFHACTHRFKETFSASIEGLDRLYIRRPRRPVHHRGPHLGPQPAL